MDGLSSEVRNLKPKLWIFFMMGLVDFAYFKFNCVILEKMTYSAKFYREIIQVNATFKIKPSEI